MSLSGERKLILLVHLPTAGPWMVGFILWHHRFCRTDLDIDFYQLYSSPKVHTYILFVIERVTTVRHTEIFYTILHMLMMEWQKFEDNTLWYSWPRIRSQMHRGYGNYVHICWMSTGRPVIGCNFKGMGVVGKECYDIDFFTPKLVTQNRPCRFGGLNRG